MANGTAPLASAPLKAGAGVNGTAKASNSATKPAGVNGAASKRTLPHWTRAEIASRICAGQALVVRHDVVLNVGAWQAYHPGGVLALSHFVGRDAADEMAAYHSDATLSSMHRYAVARVHPDDYRPETGFAPLTPPITLGLVPHLDGVKGHFAREGAVRLASEIVDGQADGSADDGVGHVNTKAMGNDAVILTPEMIEPLPKPELDRKIEHARSKAYHDLKARVAEAGLFTAPGPLAGYGGDIVRYTLFFVAAQYLFWTSTGYAGQMASAVFLGLFWWQLTFFAHDAGHTGVTGDWWKDRMLAMSVANWGGGLSAGWWCDNHDIHHLVTNHPEHDPDIQHMPFFAISNQFFRNLWSTYYKRVVAFDAPSRFLLAFQHRLYYVVLSLARFNLYALSYGWLFTKAPRNAFFYYEAAGLSFYWLWYGSMLRSLVRMGGWKMMLAYLLISHITASPIHVQIVLSHFACSTEDLGPKESFVSRQLRTTMDVICSESIEWIHGGLHMQVTHHLFPRLPRHNQRKASLLTKEFCKELDIKYLEYGWIHGNRMVLGTLQDVANQLTILKQVADKEVREKVQADRVREKVQ